VVVVEVVAARGGRRDATAAVRRRPRDRQSGDAS